MELPFFILKHQIKSWLHLTISISETLTLLRKNKIIERAKCQIRLTNIRLFTQYQILLTIQRIQIAIRYRVSLEQSKTTLDSSVFGDHDSPQLRFIMKAKIDLGSLPSEFVTVFTSNPLFFH